MNKLWPVSSYINWLAFRPTISTKFGAPNKKKHVLRLFFVNHPELAVTWFCVSLGGVSKKSCRLRKASIDAEEIVWRMLAFRDSMLSSGRGKWFFAQCSWKAFNKQTRVPLTRSHENFTNLLGIQVGDLIKFKSISIYIYIYILYMYGIHV